MELDGLGHAPGAGPRLISDFSGTPTPGFGKWVKQALDGTLPPYAAPAAKKSAAARQPR